MLKCWNNGIMGIGILKGSVKIPPNAEQTKKYKIENILIKNHYSILPLFHYSINGLKTGFKLNHIPLIIYKNS
jgi:hypothetical protein